MMYTVYYDDYHNHQHEKIISASNDEDAKKKSDHFMIHDLRGLGYGDEELWCTGEIPNRKLNW